MKTDRLACSAGLLILLSTSIPFVQAQQDQAEPLPLTAEQHKLNLESFEYIWNTVNERYWDPNFGGLDWQAVRDELQPKIEKSRTIRESRSIMRDMLSRLKVSHFAVIPKEAYRFLDEPESDLPDEGTVGLDARVVDERALVTRVVDDSPAAKAGVRPGWEIVRVGEQEVAAGIQELMQEYQDNPMRRTILSAALRSRFHVSTGENVTAQFRDGQGQIVEKTMTAVAPPGRKSRFGHLPEFYVNIEVKRLEPNIGYVTFNAFMLPPYVMQKFNQAMIDFMDVDGIIIDIRGNGGGMGEMAAGMIGWLIGGEDEVLGKILIRDLELKMIAKPRPKRYTGPVVLLIDELSVSAAEFMASGVKDTGCGFLIGTRTAGAVLGSSVERLPNGDGFQYAAANFISLKTGKMLEGIGVPPDLEVKLSQAALLEGHDPALEAAVTWIRNEGIRRSSGGDEKNEQRDRHEGRPFSGT